MEVTTPDLGVDSAEVIEILVAVGDEINTDDNIALLESDKASVEVPSTSSGTVKEISIAVGDTVEEGTVLIVLEENGKTDSDSESDTSNTQTERSKTDNTNEDISSEKVAETSKDEDGTQSEQTYALPDLGVEQAEVADVLIEVGDTVGEDDSVLLIESDKASVEVPAPAAGVVKQLLVATGDTVENGQDFIVIAASSASNRDSSQSASQTRSASNNNSQVQDKDKTNHSKSFTSQPSKQPQTQVTNNTKLSEAEVNAKLVDVYAGPAVRKLARQLGVDITQVEGSAINERIVKEDVFDYVKQKMQSQGSGDKSDNNPNIVSSLPNLPDMSNQDIWGEVETKALSRLQKVSIPQLTYNTYLPQVTQFDLSDITDTEALRKSLKPELKAEGIGLTILAFIVKATAYALMQYPRFNSHLSDDHTEVHLRKTVNMGVAVATDDGLIVPVIKDAQTKGIKQIAIEIGDLANKARDKKLGAKELQGASFTISSQGNLGGTYFTPLVNWPQVGILGISEATMQPRWNENKQSFEPRLMLPLSLSYDHRVINGADAAVFTRYVGKLLADPRRILL